MYLGRLAFLAPFALVIAIAIGSWVTQGKPISCTRNGAILTLNYLNEWAKWMTGIESAALGALGFLVFGDKKEPLDLTYFESLFAWLSLFFLGFALITSAWILAALPSIATRIHQGTDDTSHPDFDVLEKSIFARTSPKLGFVVTIHHWLWGLGLLSLGSFAVAAYVFREHGKQVFY